MLASALLALLAVAAVPPEKSEKPEYVPPMLKKMAAQTVADPFGSDARLGGVCFVDPQNGWAVGDRGVIWHTADGGKKWTRQTSGVKCALTSVCFLDEKTGYAAGGFAIPYSHRGQGVFLATRDGGQTWTCNPKLLLPSIKRIGFFDDAQGWAIATPSAMFPAGALTTEDRGKTWQPMLGPGSEGWLTGVFFGPRSASLAGRNGTIAESASGSLDAPIEGAFGLRNVRDVRIGPQKQLLIAGDGGLIAAADHFGPSRHVFPAAMPEGAMDNFDFRALAVQGPTIWLAGSPGTVVFRSNDSGQTWEVFATGSPLPIYAMTFVDAEHGWAVGSLGTILATSDGGKSWQLQRSGGGRAAVLGIFSEPEDVPFELFAKLSAQDGYLSVVEAVARRDLEVPPNDETPLADRMHQASVEAGACEGELEWNFPLRQKGIQISPEQILDGWNRANGRDGLAAFQSHLVRQIRLWRPELIVTQEIGPRTKDPLSQLIGRCVLQAVEDAANAEKFPDQIRKSGLEPWRVKKIFAVAASGSHGAADLTTSQLVPRLGVSLADAAADPRGLIADRFAPTPAVIGFRSLLGAAEINNDAGAQAVSMGMGIQAGKDARRDMNTAQAENIEALHQAALKRRNAQAIIELSASNSLGSAQLLAQADRLIAGLDESAAGRILFQMGDMYARSGRWAMAAETYRALLKRYPNHPLAQTATLWLMQYYASGEAAKRESEMSANLQNMTPGDPAENPGEGGQSGDRFALATALGKEIERTSHELYSDPAFRFPLAAVERRKAAKQQAEPYYLAASRSARRDAWSQCALGEIALEDRKEKTPKPTFVCVRAKEKPMLDGLLDDEVWRKTKPVSLVSTQRDDDDWPAVAALAYDEEFLYVAVTCKKKGRGERGEGREEMQGKEDGGQGSEKIVSQADGEEKTKTAQRRRDSDLSARDRVDLLIDIDRDYSTYYQFTVDHRGWTAESCFGDSSWNPDWFVASRENEETWTVEYAIPLEEIVEKLPQPREVWAIGIQRVYPGVGFQSWTTPASTDIRPEGFGYLIFD